VISANRLTSSWLASSDVPDRLSAVAMDRTEVSPESLDASRITASTSLEKCSSEGVSGVGVLQSERTAACANAEPTRATHDERFKRLLRARRIATGAQARTRPRSRSTFALAFQSPPVSDTLRRPPEWFASRIHPDPGLATPMTAGLLACSFLL
jgi:hypothetical protein